ncbi:MAG: hypothetical protein LKI93_03130 [Bifidobacteriaceae bacterium]|jgi:uncharacterized protein YycO|nr:hypothetical protein [Bifidobacteriaceae bacterium]
MNKFLKRKMLIFVATAGSIVMTVSMVTPAFASTPETEYRQVLTELSASLNGSLSVDELDEQAQQASRDTGKDKLELAKSVLEQSENNMTSLDAAPGEKPSRDVRSGGNSGKHNPLRNSKHVGDVFVSEGNNTFGWNHGHAGIYAYNTKTCIEAPGGNSKARKVARNKTVAAGRALIQEVKVSQAKRNSAASRAKKYIGRGYNASIFTTNKNDWGGLNCSQLVWAAYKYGAKTDLDPHHSFVYPYGIRDSKLTHTYATVNV